MSLDDAADNTPPRAEDHRLEPISFGVTRNLLFDKEAATARPSMMFDMPKANSVGLIWFGSLVLDGLVKKNSLLQSNTENTEAPRRFVCWVVVKKRSKGSIAPFFRRRSSSPRDFLGA